MDIKDFILIGGGALIAAVVAHGFWIAWRDRRQDLRIDIKPDLIPDDVDELVRLRGELPNGGSRPARRTAPEQQQDLLDLEAPPPLLLEPTEAPPRATRAEAAPRSEPARQESRVDPVLGSEPSPRRGRIDPDMTFADLPLEDFGRDAAGDQDVPAGPLSRPAEAAEERARVREVAMPEPIVADEPRRPRRLGQRRSAGESDGRTGAAAKSGGAASSSAAASGTEKRDATAPMPVEELIVMNVLAVPGAPYTGDELFTALRSCGLKFGDMNIFHRVEPLTKVVQYSVASAVEPGTFDMADMESIRCPGLCLFMQLPGPEDPTAAFEDMLGVARSVAGTLGGEVRDEHRNVMTLQTVEHYRQRIVDFSRRRMSKRA